MFKALRDEIVALYASHKIAVLTVFGLGFLVGAFLL
jgi:hypothetical protein